MSSNSNSKFSIFHRHYEHLLELTLLPLLIALVVWQSSRGSGAESAQVCRIIKYCCTSGALVVSAASIPFLHCRPAASGIGPGVVAAGRILLWAACILLATVWILYRLEAGRQFWGMPGEDVELVGGTLISDASPDGRGGARARLKLAAVKGRFGTSAQASGTATVVFSRPLNLFMGCRLNIPAELLRLSSADEAADEVDEVDEVDEASYLVHAQELPQTVGYSHALYKLRAHLMQDLQKRLQSVGRSAPCLLQALLLGYRRNGAGGLAALFRRAGCAHLLALSGMHLGILSLGILIVLTPLAGRRLALQLSFVTILAYLFLVGPRPSMLRAVLMYGVGVLAFLFLGLKVNPHYLLAVTFLLHVLFFPRNFEDLGFQLSYTALAGICGWTSIISRCLPTVLPRGVREGLAATIAAQCCTAALVVKSFGVLYPVGFISPLFLTPLVTIWMWSGLAYLAWTLFLSFCPPVFTAADLIGIDLLFRGILEEAALLTTASVRWWSGFRTLRIPEEQWPLVAVASICVLTLFSLSQYAGRYGRRIKLQLSKIDRSVSAAEWDGANPPLWAELPHFSAGSRENSRAA
ncbi:MAG: ComEC/Rec2 family competence protein [Spirochaetota bacterium]